MLEAVEGRFILMDLPKFPSGFLPFLSRVKVAVEGRGGFIDPEPRKTVIAVEYVELLLLDCKNIKFLLQLLLFQL